MSLESLLIEFVGPNGWSLAVDCEGSAVYAYLRNSGKMVNHVWLMNAPDCPFEEPVRGRPPMNRPPFCTESQLEALPAVDDLQTDWKCFGEGVEVALRFRGEVLAVLDSDSRPGKSRYTAAPSKLSRPL